MKYGTYENKTEMTVFLYLHVKLSVSVESVRQTDFNHLRSEYNIKTQKGISAQWVKL